MGPIQLLGISKSFAEREVLREIDLHLRMGQTHVLLGSSGSGKSTLLRIICGLMAASRGQVRLGDVLVTPERQTELAPLFGYVIQDGGLFPHLTARQNVSLAARSRGWPQEQIEMRLATLKSLVQIDDDVLDRRPANLSGGQKQRVALMRALMLDPPILLLDEPLGALDPLVRSDLQKELKRIFNEVKKTVVMVTHDVVEGAFFGHSISLLHEGRLLQHGRFEDLLERPSDGFVTRFLRAQMPPPELWNVRI